MAAFNLFKRLLGDSDRRERERVQAQNGARMLVVDDSSTIRAVLAKMLIQDGYTVLKAGDGETALEIARQEKPDLIFLDIVLPGMNGFAVLRALRRDDRTRDIPIVMISGNLQATEQFYVQRFGADDFMKKPFGRAEVFSRIQELVKSGRLPEREPESAFSPAVPDLEDMAHIPDVALPDEDLDEHDSLAAQKGGIEQPTLERELAAEDSEAGASAAAPRAEQPAARDHAQAVHTTESPEAGDPAKSTSPDQASEPDPLVQAAEPVQPADRSEVADPPVPRPSNEIPQATQHELPLQHDPAELPQQDDQRKS